MSNLVKVVKVYDTREPKADAEEQEPVERATFDEIRNTLGVLKDRVMSGEVSGLKHKIEDFDEHGKAARVRIEYEELPPKAE